MSVLTDNARPTTLEAEISGYRELARQVRAARGFVAARQHSSAREVCEQLVALATRLEEHARERTGDDGLHPGPPGADGNGGGSDADWSADMAELIAAQESARQELAVTLEVLTDMRAHTQTLLSVLLGTGPALYDSQGRKQRAKGQG